VTLILYLKHDSGLRTAGIDMSYGSQGRMKTSVVPSCPKSSVGHPFF
jgi:hypothetical protein